MSTQVSETTRLLLNWTGGDSAALEALTPHVYRELRRMAANFMKGERKDHTLQATALVHEVYLKLIDARKVAWEGKAHFFAICAQLMRRILVDAARKRAARKHGAGHARINLDDVSNLSSEEKNDKLLIALNDALDELREADARKAKIVEMRHFGGLSGEETAAVLHVSTRTVERDFQFAKTWLMRELSGGSSYKHRLP